MSYVTVSEIKEALATGKPVWSHAAGRYGKITHTEGRCTFLRSGRLGKGQSCVTWFDEGDKVEIIDIGDKIVIRNIF